ncbi:restriction endonuclease subunit S [Candidatus Weimeria sp. HCP3S3_B5]|uniref:restriction endonuclease subunit S n=1 Tax=Candidatus Weimeria sp. HCP3S3_B5 TaxID=3438871 RepID=UPI003F8A5E02
MNERKAPEIRFKGFTDDWEQRKLGECFTERKESMPEGELISVTIGEGIKKFSELGRHDNSNDNKSKYKKVCVGDIAYNSMRMWQGASGYSPYEGIVSPAYTVLSPITDVVDSKCISYLFKRSDMTHVFQMNSQGITSDNWNLKYPALSEIEIMVSPYLAEQHKIAAYLSGIDNLITLHQRKHKKLLSVKKSMLEKMFPQNGARVPEIRFEGFTDVWEQRKLSEIYGTIRNAFVGTATPYYVDEGHFYLESNNVKDGSINRNSQIFINDEFYNKQRDKWLHTGDIVMVQSGHVGHSAVIPESLDNTAAHALIMFQNQKVETDPYFLNAEYQTDEAKRQINDITKGNTIKHILASDMHNFLVDVPSLPEQHKIACFFQDLDNIITLHQRELDKLVNIKKSMLEKMFA